MKSLRFKEARKLEKQFVACKKDLVQGSLFISKSVVSVSRCDNKSRINLLKAFKLIPKTWKTLLLDAFNSEITTFSDLQNCK